MEGVSSVVCWWRMARMRLVRFVVVAAAFLLIWGNVLFERGLSQDESEFVRIAIGDAIENFKFTQWWYEKKGG